MYDCSSLKCQRCIQKYCCCCCPGISSDQKYPHIAYGKIQLQDKEKFESQKTVESPHQKIFHYPKPVEKRIKSVPYQKIFQYPQPQQSYSIHPQLDQSSQLDSGITSVVSQQPHLEHSGGIGDSDETQDLSKKQLVEYSPYGSMEDVGAKVGFVDVAKLSVYVESDEADSLYTPQRCDSGPGLVSRARSVSPLLPSMPSINDMGIELQKKSLQPIYPSPEASCIHFSLYYDETSQKLIVHLKQVFKLPTSRPEESCNPFAEVYLLPKKNYVHKSHILMKTHNPVFDETFKFADLDLHVIRKQTVLMRMYINDRSHFVGGVLYPLESASMDGDLIKVAISEFDEEESLKVRVYTTEHNQ